MAGAGSAWLFGAYHLVAFIVLFVRALWLGQLSFFSHANPPPEAMGRHLRWFLVGLAAFVVIIIGAIATGIWSPA
jgi:hypothetical protein